MSSRVSTGIPDADWETGYSSPFILPSSAGFPKQMDTALDLCEYLFFLHPEYASAAARLIAHFMTGIDFVKNVGGRGEKDELKDILENKLDIKGGWRAMGLNWACFGNSFSHLYIPFDRFLLDRRGATTKFWSLSAFKDVPNVRYNHDRLTYSVPDPLKLREHAGNLHGGNENTPMVEFEIYDHQSSSVDRLFIRQLDPRHLVLDEAMSGRAVVYDKFNPEFIAQIKNNQLHQINETPLAILRAISKDQVLRYNEGQVFHMKEPTIVGLSNRGWGISPVLRNYRAIHQLSVYRKIDEVVGRDYMLPFRVITPNFGPNMDEAAMRLGMSTWQHNMQRMVQVRRKNEQVIHTLPFPVSYQEFGASGKALSTKDHLQFQSDAMLNAMGYPGEIFRGTMQMAALPTALRMLEANFFFIYRSFDQFTKWVARQVQEFRQQEFIEPTVTPPRMADDLEQRHIWLQMAAGGEIPRKIAYSPFNIPNPVEAAKERMREDQELAREQAKLQAEMAQEEQMGSMEQGLALQMQGAQGPAGAPPGGGGAGGPIAPPQGGGVTPLRVQQDAESEAQRLLNTEEGARRKELQQLEASNPNYHAVVTRAMEKLRQKGESMGRQQAGQLPPG